MSNGDGGGRNDLRMPDDDEVFAEVVEMLGANRVKVRCADGKQRTARIPGRMQKRVWIREDDIVLVEPWDWQDEKADLREERGRTAPRGRPPPAGGVSVSALRRRAERPSRRVGRPRSPRRPRGA